MGCLHTDGDDVFRTPLPTWTRLSRSRLKKNVCGLMSSVSRHRRFWRLREDGVRMIVLPCGNILCACRPCCHTNQLVLAKTCRTWVSTLDSLKSTLLCFFKSVFPLFSHVLYQPSCGCFRQTERGAARGSHAAERKAEGLWGNLGWSLHPGSSHGSRQSESPQPAAKQLPGQPGRSHQQRSAACSEWADGWDKVRVKVNVSEIMFWIECVRVSVSKWAGQNGKGGGGAECVKVKR